jgi:hypothetical protein
VRGNLASLNLSQELEKRTAEIVRRAYDRYKTVKINVADYETHTRVHLTNVTELDVGDTEYLGIYGDVLVAHSGASVCVYEETPSRIGAGEWTSITPSIVLDIKKQATKKWDAAHGDRIEVILRKLCPIFGKTSYLDESGVSFTLSDKPATLHIKGLVDVPARFLFDVHPSTVVNFERRVVQFPLFPGSGRKRGRDDAEDGAKRARQKQ